MKRTIARPVSLSDWTIIPSIDFISILVPRDEISCAGLLPDRISERVELPRLSRDIVLTLHDPEGSELQALINAWPNAEIHEIEFTLDFHQLGEVSARTHNEELFRWFSDCFVPAIPNARQRYFVGLPAEQELNKRIAGKYSLMPKAGSKSTTTRMWENRDQHIKNRLYIKCDTWKGQMKEWVRLEATIDRAGCQLKGVQKLWQLVPFASDARKILSPLFNIASGIKPQLRRVDRFTEGTARQIAAVKANELAVACATRGWTTRGAMWAAEKGLQTIPHREANARIGKALDRLRLELSGLKLPNFSPLSSFNYDEISVRNQGVGM